MSVTSDLADLTHLGVNKLNLLRSTWAATLASDNAEDACAQIIDGKPTRPSFIKNYGYPAHNTIISDQNEPSEHSLQLYNDIRLDVSVEDLRIDVKVGGLLFNLRRVLQPIRMKG